MPYTALDPTLPNGLENASTIDDIIRGLKTALIERMQDGFGGNFSTDEPYRAKKIIIPAAGIVFRKSDDSADVMKLTDTALTLLAGYRIPASQVSDGTFPDGTYTHKDSVFAKTVRRDRVAGGNVSGTVNNVGANASCARYVVTGTTTFNLAAGTAGQDLIVEVLQDNVGGRSYSFNSIIWNNGITPTYSTVANRKAIYVFYFDGAAWLGGQFGENFASTG